MDSIAPSAGTYSEGLNLIQVLALQKGRFSLPSAGATKHMHAHVFSIFRDHKFLQHTKRSSQVLPLPLATNRVIDGKHSYNMLDKDAYLSQIPTPNSVVQTARP